MTKKIKKQNALLQLFRYQFRIGDSTYHALIWINTFFVGLFLVFAFLFFAWDQPGDPKKRFLRTANKMLSLAWLRNNPPTKFNPEKKMLAKDSGTNINQPLEIFEMRMAAEEEAKVSELIAKISPSGVFEEKYKVWYPAQIIHDKKTYNVKARIRGDLSNHWMYKKKSWRLKFSKNNLALGRYRDLNFVVPYDKGLEVEQVVYTVGRKLGLLVPDSGFARMTLNGEEMGVYFWFEQPGKGMLARMGYSKSQIFTDNDSHYMNRIRTFSPKKYNEDILTSPKKYGEDISTQPSNYKGIVEKKSPLAGQIQRKFMDFLSLVVHGTNEEIANGLPGMLDLDKFNTWYALSIIFGSDHGMTAPNVKWFYNASSQLLEPIPYDVSYEMIGKWYGPNYRNDQMVLFESTVRNPVIRKILSLPEFRIARYQKIYDVVNGHGEELLAEMTNVFHLLKGQPMMGVKETSPNHLSQTHIAHMKIVRSNLKTLNHWLLNARIYIEASFEESGNNIYLTFDINPDANGTIGIKALSLRAYKSFRQFPDIEQIWFVDPRGQRRLLKQKRISKNDEEIKIYFENDVEVWSEFKDFASPRTSWKLVLALATDGGSAWRSSAYPRSYEFALVNGFSGKRLDDTVQFRAAIALPMAK